MIERAMADPRQRQLLVTLFLVGSSAAAGWSIYHGKLKILALLGLVTAGVFLRMASFANAYLLTLLAMGLALVRFEAVKEEFDRDKWLALILLAALSIALAIFQIRSPAWPRFVHVFVLGLVIVCGASFTWSVMPTLSFQKGGVFSLVLLIAFVGIWSWARTLDQVRRIVDVHVESLLLVWPLSFAALVTLGGAGFVASRFRGIFINPNNVGFWGSLSIPLLFGLMLMHPIRSRRIACGFLLAAALPCVFLSGSRGGILGAAMGVGMYCVLRFPKPTLSLAAAAVTIVGFLVLYEVHFEMPAMLDPILRKESLGDLGDRTAWWSIAILICQQRPWLGHGFGLTDLLFGHYGLDVGDPSQFGATVHNSYLEAAMNIGLIGLGLVTIVLTWTTLAGLWTWWRDRHGPCGLMALTLTSVLVAASAHSAVESTMFAAGNPWSLPLWVTAALINRLAAIGASQRAAAKRARPRLSARALPRSLPAT